MRNKNRQDKSGIICQMGVVYGRGFGVGLPVPKTSFEKLGPMKQEASNIVLELYKLSAYNFSNVLGVLLEYCDSRTPNTT